LQELKNRLKWSDLLHAIIKQILLNSLSTKVVTRREL
jgi:hypothetical protein